MKAGNFVLKTIIPCDTSSGTMYKIYYDNIFMCNFDSKIVYDAIADNTPQSYFRTLKKLFITNATVKYRKMFDTNTDKVKHTNDSFRYNI
jgi:hypothetical protein